MPLVADPESAQTGCADANGNGEAGLTTLAFLARNARTGERVPVSLTTAETEDIDENGAYVVTLRIGDVAERVEVAVLVVPRRRRRRPCRRH